MMETERLLGESAPRHRSSASGAADDLHQNQIDQHYGSINSEASYTARENASLCDSIKIPETVQVYKRRWYILMAFASLAFTQGYMPNVWAVVAQSAEPAFGWTDATISLMMNWIYITYLLAMLPFAWIMDNKGLRPAVLLSASLVVLGAGLRCVTTSTPYVTWLSHAGHVLVGLAGPVCFTAGPSISAKWFPPYQRATATAIAVVMGYAGAAGCFIVGPLIVEPPKWLNTTHQSPSDPPSYSNIAAIKEEIIHCRYVECAFSGAVLVMLLIYFPSDPPLPPSISAAQDKLNFRNGLRDLFKRDNINFWLVGLPYGLSVSIYGLWSALFDVNLKSIGVTERTAGWMGFYAVTAGCLAAVVIGRIADYFVAYMKVMLLVLTVACAGFTFWFVLMAEGYIDSSPACLYTACVLQCFCNNGAIPLYYELAIEGTYPVAEVVTSAMMTIIYNILPLIFLLLFWIPDIGHSWMNWCMYGAVLLSFPMLLVFKVRYKRLEVDKSDQPGPGPDPCLASGPGPGPGPVQGQLLDPAEA